MKNIIMIAASVLCTLSTTAQVVTSGNCRKLNDNTYCVTTQAGETVLTKDGTLMPGVVFFKDVPACTQTTNPPPIIEQKYCIETIVWKTFVMSNGEIISGNTSLKGGATLTDAGNVIWSDNSRTQLKNGACIDESGTIYGSATISPVTANKSNAVANPKLDVMVYNKSFFPPR
jgi:hypothetical protein